MKKQKKFRFKKIFLALCISLGLSLLILGSENKFFDMQTANAEDRFVFYGGVKDVQGGRKHALVLTDLGAVYSFGDNSLGQLGHGDTTDVQLPKKIEYNFDGKPILIAAGWEQSMVVTEKGYVYTFGSNEAGALGNGSDSGISATPTKVDFDFKSDIKIANVGLNNAMVVTTDDEIYAWGYNGHGQLGLGNNTNVNSPQKISQNFNDEGIKYVTGEDRHTMVLTSEGNIYMSGENHVGSMAGLGSRTSFTPLNMSQIDGDVKSVSAGVYTGSVTTTDGKVYFFGQNDKGQLGGGTNNDFTTPTLADASLISGTKIYSSAGGKASFIVTDEGKVYGTGSQLTGGFGGSSATRNTFKEIEFDFEGMPQKIELNSQTTYLLTDKGYLYAWGVNDNGQVGNNTTNSVYSPFRVNSIGKPEVKIDGNIVEDKATYYATTDATLTYTDPNGIVTNTHDSEHKFTEEGTYKITVENTIGGKTEITLVVDKTNPEVTLTSNGDTTTVKTGETYYYNKPVTINFNDNNGSGINSSTLDTVTISDGHEIDITTEKTYELEIEDVAGNVTVVTIVIDTTIPILSIDTTLTNDSANITLESNEDIAAYSTDNGQSWKTVFNRQNYTLPTGLEEGEYQVLVKDASGNESNVINIEIDTTDPKVTIPPYEQKITGVKYYSDDIKISEVSVDDKNFNKLEYRYYDKSTGWGSWEQFSVDLTTEGTYVIQASDLAGNKKVYLVVIDKTMPQISVDGNLVANGETHYTNEAASIDASDNNIYKLEYRYDDGTGFGEWKFYEEEFIYEGTYEVKATDKSNNEILITLVIDDSLPDAKVNGLAVLHEETYYFNDNAELTYISEDMNLALGTHTSGHVFTDEGKYTIEVVDLAGNKLIFYVVVDRTSPVITGVVDGSSVNTDVTIVANDDVLLKKLEYSTDGGKTWHDVTGPFTYEGDYLIRATDKAGNIAELSFTIDKTKPEINVDTSDIRHEVETPFTDPTCSVTDNSGETISCEFSEIDVNTPGEQTLTITATDSSGNVTTVTITVLILTDATPPEITVDTSDINVEVNTTFTPPTCSVTDDSGETITCEFSEIDTSKLGEQTLTVTATDSHGNETTKTIKVVIEDTTPPEITIDTSDIEHEINTTFTPPTCEVTDNSGETITCEFSEINTSVTGEQTLTVTATDASGNTTTKTIKVTIVDNNDNTDGNQQDEDNFNYIPYIAGGGLSLLLLLIIIYFIRKYFKDKYVVN